MNSEGDTPNDSGTLEDPPNVIRLSLRAIEGGYSDEPPNGDDNHGDYPEGSGEILLKVTPDGLLWMSVKGDLSMRQVASHLRYAEFFVLQKVYESNFDPH